MGRRLWRAVLIISILGLVFTAFMGFAHTKRGRPMLAWLGRATGKGAACPLGYDKTSSLAEREAFRRNAAANHQDRQVASKRKVFSFVLGETSRTELLEWVTRAGGTCRALNADFQIECVGTFFHSDTTTLWVEFDSKNTLVSLRGVENLHKPDEALALFDEARQDLHSQGRSNSVEQGDAKKDVVGGGLLAQALIAAEFSNFSAVVRLTNMAEGLAITQSYASF